MIAGSFKPPHAGHVGLIELAASENDFVKVYISPATRARPGEMPVHENDVIQIWNEILIPLLPENTSVEFVHVPVKSLYDEIGRGESAGTENVYKIYSDPVDLSQRFSPEQLTKYFPILYANGQILPRPIKRTDTVDVSGTKMRAAVAAGDFETFERGMPAGTAKAIWDILSKNAHIRTPEKKTRRRTESVLRDYVRAIVKS